MKYSEKTPSRQKKVQKPPAIVTHSPKNNTQRHADAQRNSTTIMKGKLFTLLVLLVALCAIAVSEARPSPAQSLRNFNEPPSERASKGGSEVSQSRSSEKSHDGAVFPIPGPDDDDPPEVFSPDWWERLTTVGVLIILGGIFAGACWCRFLTRPPLTS